VNPCSAHISNAAESSVSDPRGSRRRTWTNRLPPIPRAQERVRRIAHEGEPFVRPGEGFVGTPEHPQRHREPTQGGGLGILTIEDAVHRAHFAAVEADAFLQFGAAGHEVPPYAANDADQVMRLDQRILVAHLPGKSDIGPPTPYAGRRERGMRPSPQRAKLAGWPICRHNSPARLKARAVSRAPQPRSGISGSPNRLAARVRIGRADARGQRFQHLQAAA
jgi:hypothetical protein